MRRQGFPDGEPHRDTVYCQACEGPGVVPTSLGVNPQETIYGLARWGAQHVAAAV